jgi:hypothetical protein
MKTIHLGNLIKDYIDSKKIAKSSIARKLNKTDANILYYQKQPSLQVHIVTSLCHALRHNFFYDLAAQLPKEYTTSVPEDHTKDNIIAQLKEEIKTLTTEKEILLQTFKK